MRSLSLLILLLWFLGLVLWPREVNFELPIDWSQTQNTQKLYAKGNSQANVSIYNMRLYETKERAPYWLIRSRTSEIQREDDYAFLTDVDSDFYSKRTGNVIRTVSNYGRCNFRKQVIDLDGNVRIVSKRGYEFKMDTLRYLGSSREMTSPDLVTMVGPNARKPDLFVRGQGLIADIDYEHFILKRNVVSRKRLKNAQWMYIQSQTADFFTEEQRGVYVGNCHATLPRLSINSDVFEVILGVPERLHARGRTILKTRDKVARAESALIEIESNRITLDGKARVENKEGNQVFGKRITLYTDEDRIEVEGAEGRFRE